MVKQTARTSLTENLNWNLHNLFLSPWIPHCTPDKPKISWTLKILLSYGAIHNTYYCHQSGTCPCRGTHRRHNRLVCCDPLTILTDQGPIADLLQVLNIFSHFFWVFLKIPPSLVITWSQFTDLTTNHFTGKQHLWILICVSVLKT